MITRVNLGRRRGKAAGLLPVFVLMLASCAPGGGSGSNQNDNTPQNSNDNTGGNENDNTGGVTPGVEISVPNEGAQHVPAGTQVEYETIPPASGPHWSSADPPAPVDPGFYEDALEEEQWVHNLEHGYVVVLYDCGEECEASLLADLTAFADEAAPSEDFGYAKIVIAPYDGLAFPLVAIAWDVQMYLESYDEAALTAFFEKYQDEGPEHAP